MTNSTQDAIHRFILENFLFTEDATQLGPDDSLLGRGVVDSTGMLEIILFIEERFGIKVVDTEMVPENLDSVKRIATYVASKKPGP